MIVVATVLLALAAYALGTFPSARLVAGAAGVDITHAGSGNPGASNVTRLLGWRRGVVVFALDAAKGAVAAGAGLAFVGRGVAYVLVATAVLGHMFPVTRHLRGGKGVATAAGAMLVLQPVVALALMVVWFAVSRLSGKASVASLVVTVALPAGAAVAGSPAWEVAAIAAIGALVVARHLPNLRRLARGTEPGLDRDDG